MHEQSRQGRQRIARQFIAGKGQHNSVQVPSGTTETVQFLPSLTGLEQDRDVRPGNELPGYLLPSLTGLFMYSRLNLMAVPGCIPMQSENSRLFDLLMNESVGLDLCFGQTLLLALGS
ncbi:MAG: hypothetical protein GY749_43325 [Desulfobacteraceae bacterium]|nr:hypothetical protein [Desulfobacteraceae bacterium]